jgi:hypothetical protein
MLKLERNKNSLMITTMENSAMDSRMEPESMIIPPILSIIMTSKSQVRFQLPRYKLQLLNLPQLLMLNRKAPKSRLLLKLGM